MRNTVAVVLSVAGLILATSPATWAQSIPSAEAEISQTTSGTPQTFSDLPPDHWAYQTVQSLITNYGCLAGYPDGNFRGEQAVTRNEFAAGMNSCMDTISSFIQQRQQVNQAEREKLIQSMQQLQTDLDELEGEVGL